MLRLLAVEARRDLDRRLTRALVLLFVAVMVVGMAIAWVNVESYGGGRGDAVLDEAVERCVDDVQYSQFGSPPVTVEIEPGVYVETPPPIPGGPGSEPIDPEDTEAAREECAALRDAWLRGEPEGERFYYLWDESPPRAADLWNTYQNEDSLMTLPQTLLLIAGMGAAASMIGAEWKAGTITTQLTWFPRRVTLFLGKVVATCGLAALIAYALQIFFALLLGSLLASKGADMGVVDRDWILDLAAGMARTSFLVAVAAALGASLAMIFRNTAGAIIVVFAYVAVAETLLRVWQPDWARWFIGENLSIVLAGHTPERVEWEKGPAAATLTMLGYALVVVAAAAAAFRARDIASSA